MRKDINFRLKIYLAVFIVLFSGGVIGFISFENMSLTNAIYFSIVTMATVGYGDIHPQTEIGKILALIIIVGGVGTFLGLIAGITELLVNRREASIRQEKIDMITGLFFSEIGNTLLNHLKQSDPDMDTLQKELDIRDEWKDQDFERALNFLRNRRISFLCRQVDIPVLLEYLQKSPGLLLRLIENPIIQEHETFTELLRALFHLRDELLHRPDLVVLLDSDRKHLEGDIARVYNLLLFEWLHYVHYLKRNYGYLFSLAIRTNPFNPGATAVVKDR